GGADLPADTFDLVGHGGSRVFRRGAAVDGATRGLQRQRTISIDHGTLPSVAVSGRIWICAPSASSTRNVPVPARSGLIAAYSALCQNASAAARSGQCEITVRAGACSPSRL